MTKASPIQTNFTGGEWSPALDGRVDLAKYANACRVMENFVTTSPGPARRRPGTRFVAEIKDSAKRAALIPFQFSVEQAYVIEVGDQYFRFYMDNGRIENPPGTPVEIATPYTLADLFDADGRLRLRFAQSADVLFLVHPNYRPKRLTRTSHVGWTLSDLMFADGPYLPINLTNTRLRASAGTGSATLTATSAAGINGGAGFRPTDVGRPVRILADGETTIGLPEDTRTWAWGRISAFTSPTQVTVQVVKGTFPTVDTPNWRLGAWSDTEGWPAAVTFFEERLCFAGAPLYPQRMDMSRTGDFETFSPSDPDGTVVADHGIAITLNANDVNVIRWLMDDEKGLLAGAVGGEWIVRAHSLSEALSPDNVSAKRSSVYGSADLGAVRVGRSTLYLQRSGRRLRELAFVFEDDGFRSPDMTLLAEHIAGDGIVAMAYQQEPDRVLWCVRKDGLLLGLTFEREQDVIAWHRHPLGGYSDPAQSMPAACESVAAIPAPDISCDELWLIVRRRIDGRDARYIEYLDHGWDLLAGDQANAFFVDSGLSYAGPPASGFAGLDHLEGQTVAVLADGAVLPRQVIANGGFSIPDPASIVHAGLPYRSRLQTLRIEAGAADGTAQGKIKRLHRVVVRVLRSAGLLAGPGLSRLDEIPALRFRDPSTPMGAPDSLFTGDAEISWPGGYERGGHVTIETSEPLPATVIAIMPQLITQDR